MKVLLSIKPEFAKRIFDGSKKYEFRKAIFKNPHVTTCIVYASSPVKRVIGEFEIETILIDTPENLWRKTHEFSGISEELFFDYFAGREMGYAIKIGKRSRYEDLHCLNRRPPQSFYYW